MKSARSAAKSCLGQSLNIAAGAMLTCGVMAGSAWGLASAFSAMHEAGRVMSDGPIRLSLAAADRPLPQTVPTAIKSSRFLRLSESEVRGRQLSADAVLTAHQRAVAAEVALAETRRRAEQAAAPVQLASLAPSKAPLEPAAKPASQNSLVTALVEDVPAEETQPFGLVLADPDGEDEEGMALPSQIPLPEARPAIEATVPDEKPALEKPAPRAKAGSEAAVAYARPEPEPQAKRSFLGSLFGSGSSSGGWSGNGTRVAIYDVSAATVYMPDGSKLRAHSGIGPMRDNPRFEHVKMNGPTPSGIYRLSMREKRFYGVEAIRMTSIDGRDPKNRTGLLTHTNLLRGRIGSHGCVAFQNYQPFLNAFKRGQVRTLVVVPQLPSQTQLAALYRKAGA